MTASPSFKHFSGLESLFLHSMKALLILAHLIAMCLEMDVRTADVGNMEVCCSSAIFYLLQNAMDECLKSSANLLKATIQL